MWSNKKRGFLKNTKIFIMIWISLRYLECKLYAFSKFTRKLIGVKMKLDMILIWSWDCNHNFYFFLVLLGPNLCLQNISCFTWKWMSIKHCRKFLQIKMLGFIYWERVQRLLFPSFQSNQLENKFEIKMPTKTSRKALEFGLFPQNDVEVGVGIR